MATLCGAERPRVATSCRGTARRYSVQRNLAMPRSAEGPRDPMWCRETARSYGVQRDRVLDRRRGEPDAPCPSRRTLDAGEPTPNTLSVFEAAIYANKDVYNYVRFFLRYRVYPPPPNADWNSGRVGDCNARTTGMMHPLLVMYLEAR